MSSGVRSFLAFLIGCAGVALAFWGVMESVRLHHPLALLAVVLGVLACLGAFRLAPQTEG